MIDEVCLVYYSEATAGVRIPQVAAVCGSEGAAMDWADYNRKVRGANPIVWDDHGRVWNKISGRAGFDGEDEIFYYYMIETWPVQGK
jgi:hypothetical protein